MNHVWVEPYSEYGSVCRQLHEAILRMPGDHSEVACNAIDECWPLTAMLEVSQGEQRISIPPEWIFSIAGSSTGPLLLIILPRATYFLDLVEIATTVRQQPIFLPSTPKKINRVVVLAASCLVQPTRDRTASTFLCDWLR